MNQKNQNLVMFHNRKIQSLYLNISHLHNFQGPVVQWLRRVLDVDETAVQFRAGPFLR